MSELWTPGSDNKPKPEGKIELPKGFARRRETAKETGEAPEQAEQSEQSGEQPGSQAEAAPGTSQAGEGQAGPSGAPQLLFPPAGVQVQCPNCGTPFVAPVFSIVDLGANPELRPLLLGGQINVAVCPKCGAGGPLSAPLLIHDPEHEFLGIFLPSQAGLSGEQTQKIIGELTQALMAKLPGEARRGYMLRPQQFFDWNRLMEKLWEFEGVTPEMLRRQGDQVELLQGLAKISNDPTAMRLLLEQKKSLVDQELFSLLNRLLLTYRAQGPEELAEQLARVREFLLENTEAGQAIKAQEEEVRKALDQLRPEMTRDELLDLLLAHWEDNEQGKMVVGTLLTAVAPLVDYQMLMDVSQRLERTTDPEERARILSLREFLLQFMQHQQQSQAAVMERVQRLLSEVLQARDTKEALRAHAQELDELFLEVLAANIQDAESKGATAAAKRLRTVYDQALEILQESMPPAIRLLNQILSTQDEAEVRRLLQENRELLDEEFLAALEGLEERFRQDGNEALANRLKSLRAQVKLMV